MVKNCSPLGKFSLAERYLSDSRLTTPNLKLDGASSNDVSLVTSWNLMGWAILNLDFNIC